MKKNLILATLLFSSLLMFAQRSIQSTVFDSKNGLALEMATVRLLKTADSTLVQGAQTDVKGSFTLSKIKPGNYVLIVSTIGYNDYRQAIKMENRDIILKNIQLAENVKALNEVEVKGTAAQMVVKGDTLEYNATAFKTPDNAVVEDLLKKLPGVEISAEGKITVHGQDIKRIRVDGKKFFDGDIEQATKNLPADMIEKIQVVEQKSEMAQLTGFEDNETERIINLTTKASRRKGTFGNINAGAGIDVNNDFRYDGNASLNIMNGNMQNSINLGGNNLNTSRASRGRGSWGGGANAGITTSQNFGINNNTILNDNLKIGGDASINHSNNISQNESNRTSYLKETTYNDLSEYSSMNDRWSANLRLEVEWKIDSLNTIIFQPNMNYTSGISETQREYSYKTEGDSTSWGNSKNDGTNNSISGGFSVIYNRKFTSKPGRSFTANLRTNFSENESESFNNSEKYTKDLTTLLDQFTENSSNRFNTSLRMSFVEPLWNNKNMLETALSINNNNTTSVKNQYFRDAGSNFTERRDNYTTLNEEYSNNFENRFLSESLELNYRYTEQNYNIMLGLNAEPSQTKNLRIYGNGFVRDTTYSVFNFAPTGRFQYNFGKKEFARIDYRGRTEQPSIDQMQPVKNNSDLMSETVGNPGLNPSFSHNFRLMYSRFNDKTFSSFNTFLNASATKDALVSNRIYDNTLKQYNQTINSEEIPVNLNGNVMYNTPIIQKRLHFNTSSNIGYRTNYSYVSRNVNINIEHLILGDLSKTRYYNASEEIALTLTHDIIELGIRGRIGYSNSLNNLKNEVTETYDWSARGNLVLRLPYNFTISSDISYSDRAGYAINMDQSEILWNASVDKSVFKNRGTLSLKANDLLRQRLNIRQTVGDNYVQFNSYNTLPSYFILSFSYRINRFAGGASQNDFRRDERFGPGMRGSGRMREGGGGGMPPMGGGNGMF